MANVINVSVKWGKQNFSDLEMDLDQDVLTFKSQLYALTNVLVDKQKLMVKGKIIQDNDDLKNFNLKKGSKLLLMGTAEDGEPKKVVEEKKIVFLEDLSQQEIAKIYQEETGEALPCGLTNLGNTCYLNSVVQNMRRVNELRQALKDYNGQISSANLAEQYAVALKNLFQDLEVAGDAVTPFQFVNSVRTLFPMFATKDKNGYKQQDADEYLKSFLQTLDSSLKYKDSEGNDKDLIKKLFTIDYEITMKNMETEEEVPQVKHESVNNLTCYITNTVNHLHEGLKLSLEGDLTKNSELLGREAVYRRTQRINNLPSYLVVHFARFDYKQKSELAGTQATRTKVLRNVSFPKCLDIFEFCSESLQESLKPGRDFQLQQKERELEKMQGGDDKKKTQEETKKNEGGVNKKQPKEDLIEGAPDHILYKEHGSGLDAGGYQLISVVTHKGRTAESGHYVGWVHRKGDEWLEYDDDVVRLRKTEDIMALRGGGDWHMAFICVYRKIEVHNDEEVAGEKMEQD
mmetsp:Transcript_34827/g.39471  ORF Transcript_34827/g.39471 Transcript_34827/m.39471 type:complete len:516 (-) Transcript_34827:182-1729(-)|eukprot:CAMPEP_0115037488 /NCGR_PEP_ID=MMETSP0216-20121206/42831_1 /TAXON_ID=223996 /ORGANISM="Protocruzia adherens, Strain Boccale" /LENGTH=515 /DNA_ID=CAMNT_0002417683 /DNA_START=54 /DNA_END=1601 /DNA_ORIENTATION=-